jgi:glycosyltransferase involved in cell wall biosynthesis
MNGDQDKEQEALKARPLFSVVIPAYNRPHLLDRALRSVALQTYKNYEVVVVDDGSKSDLYDVVKSHPGKIHYERQENRGPGAARNLGIQKAIGTYIVFLDSDDVWFPWTLASYQEAIANNDNPSFVCGRTHRFHDEKELASVCYNPVKCASYKDYLSALDNEIVCTIFGCGVAVRRTIISKSPGFMEGPITVEDADMWLNLGVAPGFVQITSPATFGYQETISSGEENVSKKSAWIYYGIKHMLAKEKLGQYPGGLPRQKERREIICRHIRAASIGCIRQKNISGGWWLFAASFRWQLALRRFRYLLSFPMFFLFYSLMSVCDLRNPMRSLCSRAIRKN